MKTPKIGFISLGCSKNLVDSERIMTRLIAEGYEIVQEYGDADLIIINTCGFINEAVAESLDTIEEAMLENGKVIVTGCLGKRKATILERYPQVLHISGPHAYDEVLNAVHEQLPAPHKPSFVNIPEAGIKLTPKHYAYLKISEGCNHSCTFCIIPELRGPLVSRPLDKIVKEAKVLAKDGVKELLIISQDTAAYGNDLNYKNGLLDLAKALSDLKIWIRLHYLYPYPSIDELLPLMAEHKIVPYLDVPLQHVNTRLLTLMKRPADKENMLKRIEKWRAICPDITIRSTFMVGFPGETEQELEDLLAFLEIAQLDRVGCFKYSPIKGAKANELPGQLPEEIKEERLEILMNLQAQISTDKLKQKIGKTISVIIDEVNDKETIGRSYADSPEVDGQVYISNGSNLKPGDIVNVKTDDADEYDLYGHM